jgi:hypothetical protein
MNVERGIYCVEDLGKVSEEVRLGGKKVITGMPIVEYQMTCVIGLMNVDIAPVVGSSKPKPPSRTGRLANAHVNCEMSSVWSSVDKK